MIEGGAIPSRSPTTTNVAGSLEPTSEFVHTRDIGKPTTWRNDREGRAGLTPEEEHARIFARRSCLFLRPGVDVVEDRLTGGRIIDHAIQGRHDDVWVHMGVIREERPDIPESHRVVVVSVIPWQCQPTEAGECRMVQEIQNRVIGSQMPAPRVLLACSFNERY